MPRRWLLLLLAGPLAGLTEPLLKPLPRPDLSALPREQAEELARRRAEFDELRGKLVGPPLAAAYGAIGAFYARAGFFDAAETAFANAIVLLPGDFELHYLAGLSALLGGRPEAAEGHFRECLKLDPRYPATRIHLADALLALRRPAEAKRLLEEAIEQRQNLAAAHLRLGRIEREARRYPEAERHLRAALAREPGATLIYRELAELARAAGKAEAAEELKKLAGDGPVPLVDPLAKTLFGPPPTAVERVMPLIVAGELDAAQKFLREHLGRESGDVAAMALLARVEAGRGDFEEARRWAGFALRDAPSRAFALVAAGAVEEMAGEEEKALARYREAVAAEPEDPEARRMLGDLLLRRGQAAEALQHYQALAALDGERALGLPHLVAAAFRAGRCEEGLSAARAARARHPTDGVRAEIWVRAVATCAAASEEERKEALAVAEDLYRQHPDAQTAEALALIAARAGRFEEALDYQRQSLFELAKQNDRAAIERGRAWLELFQASKLPSLPWPERHPLLEPPPLRAARPQDGRG
jgi:tetratricopeptide (TPR) repeat protein